MREHLDKFEKIKAQLLQAGGGVESNSGLVYTLLDSIYPRFNNEKLSFSCSIRLITYDKVVKELIETPFFTTCDKKC